MENARTAKLLAYFEQLPKVELHLHLEGALPSAATWQLIQKYGGDPDVPDLAALAAKFRYRDFAHFIETWIWKNRFLREYEDFTFMAGEVAASLARQNVLYAEIFFSPDSFVSRGLAPALVAHAVRTGLERVPGIEVSLVLDLVRDQGPEQGRKTLEAVSEVIAQCGIVGMGIGGSEHRYPPEPFAAVYARARELGLHTNAHAGEAAGPESIWGALRTLHVDRVGHGTRAREDPALVDYLAEHRVPLEICVLSNVRTGVVASVAEHPLKGYVERGIPVSINSDDPTLFNNSLAEEYLALHCELGFSMADVHDLLKAGVLCSWLPAERKADLSKRIENGIREVEARASARRHATHGDRG